jgi:poly(A) polymerase
VIHTSDKVSIPQNLVAILRDVFSFIQEKGIPEAFLVGGAVRDLLLNKTDVVDLDIAVPVDPVHFSESFARRYRAGFVMLDQEHGVARIVKQVRGTTYTIDLTKYRAPTFFEDVHKRDFTINSLGLSLQELCESGEATLQDPLGGAHDLKNKRLRACSGEIFRDDPLRIMRAFRFLAGLGGDFSSELETFIERDMHLLSHVSPERIRDELFKIFSYPNSIIPLRRMGKMGVFRVILPELESTKGVEQNGWHHLDVFEHTLTSLEEFEALVNRPPPLPHWGKIEKFLSGKISGSRTFLEAFKFGCLLHDLGKPHCKKIQDEQNRIVFHGHEMVGADLAVAICDRLRLSNAEHSLLGKVVKNHMRPGVMVQNGLNDRRLFRYFLETGRDGVGIALLSLADRKSARGVQSEENLDEFEQGIFQILANFYEQLEYVPKAPLITGDDLIKRFQLAPGPIFKDLLFETKEAQHLGQITTKEQAFEFITRRLKELKNGAPTLISQ